LLILKLFDFVCLNSYIKSRNFAVLICKFEKDIARIKLNFLYILIKKILTNICAKIYLNLLIFLKVILPKIVVKYGNCAV